MIELDLAWRLIVEWRFLEAEQLLRAVRERIHDAPEPALPAEESPKLRLLLAHRQMMLDLFRDNVFAVEAPCRMLMREYRDADPYVAGSFYTSMIYAQRGRYRLHEIDNLDTSARQHYDRVGNPFAIVWHQSVTGPSRFLAGDATGAIDGLEEALRVAAQFRGISALASVPALPLSEIYYERNELVRATELIERYLPMASEFGFVDQLTAGYGTKARLALLDGNQTLAEATLARGLEVARARGFGRLRSYIVAEMMRIFSLAGDLERARELALAEEITGSRDRWQPNRHTTINDEARVFAWARLKLMETSCADALAVANAWHDFARDAKALRSTIRWDVLRARSLLLSGDRRGAQRALRRAVTASASRGFIRSLIDEGAVIAELLKEMHSADHEMQAATDSFVGELLAAMGASDPTLQRVVPLDRCGDEDPVSAALDAREREILSMVALGLLNREIGQGLGLTEGTVKWYLQRIFDKLGIRRRTQAVRRAREYGLLA